MSALTLVNQAVAPVTPNPNEVSIYVDTNNEPKYINGSGQVRGFDSLFGQNFASQKKTADETTTSTSFVNYDSFITQNLPEADYFVMVRYVWGYASGANDIRGQINLNGSPLIEEHRQEPKDGGVDQRFHFSTFTIAKLAGVNTIDIDYATSNGSQARMYESEIILWRIN